MNLQNLDVTSGFGKVELSKAAVGDRGRIDLLWDRHGEKKRNCLGEEEFEPEK